MKFKRLLTAGLMAVFCAGTAMAAPQLNAVQVTPAADTTTVSLRTTGSFAHKEYRPDEHLLLVDLTGVASDPGLAHRVEVKSPVLKSYALSSYTAAAGTAVTRVELTLGDNVATKVKDLKGGLQIVLSGGGPGAASAAATVAGKPDAATRMAAKVGSEHLAGHAAEPGKEKSALTPAVIRSIRVRQEQDALDVVVDGPSSAHPYLLKHPDRLVLDFKDAVMRPFVRKIAVHSGDVRDVRVGRFQSAPPVTRVVIDLSGPRVYEVLPSAEQVVVRVKTEAGVRQPAPVAMSAVEKTPVSGRPHVQNGVEVRAARASASPLKNVAMTVSSSSPLPAQPVAPVVQPVVQPVAQPAVQPVAQPAVQPSVAPGVTAGVTAERTAPLSPAAKAAAELARLSSTSAESLPGSTAAPSSYGAASTPKYTGEPISVNLKDVDLKDFFRLIHEISGLNIVLDPSVKGSVTLVLDDVPWDQALDIVLRNNQLDRQLQGNVLRIASTDELRREADARRAQAEAVALAVDRQTITRSLSYAKAAQLVPTVKKFLTARGDVISDERTNSLIISDIPSVLPTLDRLISQLDKKTQEVEIEVRVVSATRSFSRDLGFQLGFAWGNGASMVSGINSVGTATVTNPVAGRTTTIPLFSSFPAPGASTGLGFSNITSSYALDAVLTAAENHNLAKVLSRPRVVTQSNVKAEVKQGVQIPVYTSGTANANSSVTYVNAVLRLSVTPRITADNTIFLSVDVENTQPDGLAAGNANYILSTQQATTQVLVSDGATVVIGGVIQTSNTVSKSQTPLLGDIPWLGNLFKERHVSTETDELIFFITPKIIQT